MGEHAPRALVQRASNIPGYRQQLDYGTGGPKARNQLHARDARRGIGDFRDIRIVKEPQAREGRSHAGLSAVINLTGYKP